MGAAVRLCRSDDRRECAAPYYDFALASGMEQSYIDSYVRYYTSPDWLAFILLFTTLMGFLGCMVGRRLIRRHFQKAGVL